MYIGMDCFYPAMGETHLCKAMRDLQCHAERKVLLHSILHIVDFIYFARTQILVSVDFEAVLKPGVPN